MVDLYLEEHKLLIIESFHNKTTLQDISDRLHAKGVEAEIQQIHTCLEKWGLIPRLPPAYAISTAEEQLSSKHHPFPILPTELHREGREQLTETNVSTIIQGDSPLNVYIGEFHHHERIAVGLLATGSQEIASDQEVQYDFENIEDIEKRRAAMQEVVRTSRLSRARLSRGGLSRMNHGIAKFRKRK